MNNNTVKNRPPFSQNRTLQILKYLFYCGCVSVSFQCTETANYFSELSSSDSFEERFYIRFDTDHYEQSGQPAPLFELSSNNEISLLDCGVDKDSESIEDMYCILDLNEADIGVLGQAEEGIPLKYNVPKEMCEYTSFMAPWHWNQRSGLGPAVIHECKVTPPGENAQEQTHIRIPGGVTGWVLKTDDREENCEYDLSKSGLANCCFGKAKATPYTSSSTVSGCREDLEAEPSDREWGGDLKNCIGGPLRSSDWDAYGKKIIDEDGDGEIDYDIEYPIQRIFSSWSRGTREQFLIGPASEGVVQNSSTPTATYFNGIEDLLFTELEICTDCPTMFFPDVSKRTDRQSLLPIGYPYFTLTCLDSNREALHRLHLIIREWNTLEEFIAFQDSDGRSGDPDIEGTEGGDCPYYEADEKLGSDNCNDFLDLDDNEQRYPRANYEAG